MAKGNEPMHANDEINQEPLKTREGNRLKNAKNNLKFIFKGVMRPFKSQLKIFFIIAIIVAVTLIMLSASLYFLWEKYTTQDTEDPKNLPGVTANVMNARAVKTNSGIEFIYLGDESSDDHIVNIEMTTDELIEDEEEFKELMDQLTFIKPQRKRKSKRGFRGFYGCTGKF